MNIEKKRVSTERLARIALNKSCFEINGEVYQQLQDKTMGTKFSQSHTILFMAAFELDLLQVSLEAKTGEGIIARET